MTGATRTSPGVDAEGRLLPDLGRTGTILVLVVLCTALGLVFATHFRVYHRVEWPLALWWGLKDWYLWGALAPVVLWITRSAPPVRKRWMAALALHLLAALFLSILHSVLAISLSALVEGLGTTPFGEHVERLFLKRYTLNLITYAAIAAVVSALQFHRASAVRERRDDRLGTGPPKAPAKSDGEPVERLLVRRDDRKRFVHVNRIERIEAEGNYVRIHAGEETFLERRTLKSLEDQLDSSRFLRVHRSHIVNVDRVDRIEPGFKGAHEVVLRDGTTVPLSRKYGKRLEERIGESF